MPPLAPADLPVLKLGSTGKAVTAAKMGVHRWNAKKGNTTPLYGPFFRPLVKQFQYEHMIPATGVIGPNTWKALMPHLSAKARKLLPQKVEKPVVPNLGPVVRGGQTVLEHDCTHATSDIPLFPAFDDAFREGAPIIAPEPLTVTRQSSSRPGQAFYATGASGIRWWFGHLTTAPGAGRKFAKGAVVGHTCHNPIGGGPHVHVGVNVEALWGKGQQLAHKTTYQHGAPTIGSQLATRPLL